MVSVGLATWMTFVRLGSYASRGVHLYQGLHLQSACRCRRPPSWAPGLPGVGAAVEAASTRSLRESCPSPSPGRLRRTIALWSSRAREAAPAPLNSCRGPDVVSSPRDRPWRPWKTLRRTPLYGDVELSQVPPDQRTLRRFILSRTCGSTTPGMAE